MILWLPVFLKNTIKTMLDLIAVSETAHTAHDTENIVIGGVYTNLGVTTSDCVRCKSELKSRVINTRHVACSRRLVFLGLEAKRVNIDTSLRNVGVVLVRLDKIEVTTHALRESVVTIKLELGD